MLMKSSQQNRKGRRRSVINKKASGACYNGNFQKSTKLYSLIQTEEWEAAFDRLQEFPGEARVWYVKKRFDGIIKEKSLPIIAACRNAGSTLRKESPNSKLTGKVELLIQGLVEVWPESTKKEDLNKMNALHWACWSGANLNVIEILLSVRNDSVSKADVYGRLPLHIACEYGASDEAVISLLRTQNCFANVKDARGRTPIDIAEEKKNHAISEILKRDSHLSWRHTETTARSSITSSELSHYLPEFDRLAKRASERARNNSLPPQFRNSTQTGSFVIAVDADTGTEQDNVELTLEEQPSPWKVSSDETSKSFYERIQPPATQRRSSTFLKTLEGYEKGLSKGIDACDESADDIKEENSEDISNTIDNSNIDITPLSKLILEKNWDVALKRLKDFPAEAEKWRFQHEEDGSVKWKLPIHDACYRQPPLKFVKKLIEAYKVGIGCQDDVKKLPIHWACEYGASEEVVDHLLKMNPLSIFEEDAFKQKPLECVYKSEFPNKEIIVASLLMMGPIQGRPSLISQGSSDRTLRSSSDGWTLNLTDRTTKSHSSSERTLKTGNAELRMNNLTYSGTSLASVDSDTSGVILKSTYGDGKSYITINRSDSDNKSLRERLNLPEYLPFSKKKPKMTSFEYEDKQTLCDANGSTIAVQLNPATPTLTISTDPEIDLGFAEAENLKHERRERMSRSSFWYRTLYSLRDSLTSARGSQKDLSVYIATKNNRSSFTKEDCSLGNDDDVLEIASASKNFLVDDSRTLLCLNKKAVFIIYMIIIGIAICLIAWFVDSSSKQDERPSR